jgi:hypothetical protein
MASSDSIYPELWIFSSLSIGRATPTADFSHDTIQLAAFPALLDRRARNRTIGAKHTAIAGEGLESLAAALAIVEELAGVSGHGLN